ncbi:hypothetical protein ACEWY4_009002 [Coilia grayii]|uniref:Uncharacterized protein n=1 Tax=Coilia grayii TaxID=363190 RepID=A0ABD1K567_9TELE
MADSEQMPAVKEFLLNFFMPEKCYDEFFLHFNFAHGEANKHPQLPQIWKVLKAGSAQGLSLASALLGLYAISGYVAYCIARGFPVG